MSEIFVLGQHTQGLITACLLAKSGNHVSIAQFPNDTSYEEFTDGCKTGPVVHMPLVLPHYIVDTLQLDSYGFELPSTPIDNPFQKLPFYDGLKKLIEMFQSLDMERPPYREKAWRDTWSTFEISRVLAEYDTDIQSLFAKSATLSLNDLLMATDLNDSDQAQIISLCTIGAKTNPSNAGTAMAILPAMAMFESEKHILLQGSLHSLSTALRESAMALGVNIIDNTKIRKIQTHDNVIQSVIMDDETEVVADHYVLDFDPVTLFDEYLNDYSISPAFKNRVFPKQNLKECIHVKMVVSGDFDIPQIIAPSVEYIQQARSDLKSDGGSQKPVLSIVNVSKNTTGLSPAGHIVLSVIAQYFEPNLDNDDAIIMAVKQSMLENIDGLNDDNIIHASVHKMPSQFGQPTFNTAMPLLQLFRVFAGHHSIAYDMPIENLVVAGYGGGTANHHHTFNGGERVATLLQSL